MATIAAAAQPAAPGETIAPVLRATGLRKRYGEVEVLKSIDFSVAPGEVLVLIGRSGSGESTCLRCVNMLEVPNGGVIEFGDWRHDYASGRLPAGRDIRQLRRQIGMVFQQFNLWPHLTAERNVMLALRDVLHLSQAEARDRAQQMLSKVGLGHKSKSRPGELSGGQQQRVAIARSLALEPKVMMFDEVTSSLDPELAQSVLEEMRRLADGGMTMLVVTHEMRFARDVGDRVMFMDKGLVVEQGSARQVITDPVQAETRSFLRSFIG